MRIRIDSATARVCFVVACIAIVCPFCFFAARAYLARRAANTVDVEHLQTAVRLEAGDASNYALLGMLQLSNQQNASLAQTNLLTATRLNPYDSRYWLYLATADRFLNDGAGQRIALERAVESEPTNPQISWITANSYLASGETTRALRLLRAVLESSPSEQHRVLSIAWRATSKNTDLLLRELVPAGADGSFQFLGWLIAHGEPDAADFVWRNSQRLKQSPDGRALPYVESLLARKRVDDAKAAWDAIAASTPSMAKSQQSGNLVFNGAFEQEPLNAGFDWHIASSGNMTVMLDSATAHLTSRSLSLSFSGNGGGDPSVYQFVAVQPDTKYQLRAFEKTEELYSASTPRVRIADARTDAEMLSIETTPGSTAWHEVGGEFQTGPECRLLKIALQVPPRMVRGTMWLAEVSIEKKPVK